MATLKAEWLFNEGSGQYCYDELADVQAKIYNSTPGDRKVAFASGGTEGGCLDCTGDSSTYDLGALVVRNGLFGWPSAEAPLLTEVGTITLWFKTGTQQNKCLFMENRIRGGIPYDTYAAGLVFFENSEGVYVPGYAGSFASSAHQILQPDAETFPGCDDDEWHFVGVRCIRGTYPSTELFIDGCEALDSYPDNTWNGGGNYLGIYDVRIGGGQTSQLSGSGIGSFAGKIDRVRYYSDALTNDEICEVYESTKPVSSVVNAMMFSCNT